MISHILLASALIGTISATVFLGLALLGVRKFALARKDLQRNYGKFQPPVSILKPLHGMEPQLERNIESFFDQDYSGRFELLFCARSEADEGLILARRVAERHPNVTARFVTAGEPPYTNAKVWSLEKMGELAAYPILIVTDSDVEVGRDYLQAVVAPFANQVVGCVTCLYRGKPTGGFWSRLEGLGMSVEMTSGVVTANLLEGMKFALGPTMAVRREALDQTGGFRALKDFASDDFVLGNKIAGNGLSVVLSGYVVDHVIVNRSFWDSMRHQVRWMKSTRFSRPKGHLGTGLTFAMPFGLLGLAAAGVHSWWGWGLLLWAYFSRVLQSAVVGWVVVRDRRAITWSWAYPLRDLMGFIFWFFSYLGAEIVWRGERYRLVKDGCMVAVENVHSPVEIARKNAKFGELE